MYRFCAHSLPSTILILSSLTCIQDQNIILAHTYEYRLPSLAPTVEELESADTEGGKGKITKDLSSRYLGLVVVPGEHIVKIELEEFVNQMKGKEKEQRQQMAMWMTSTLVWHP